jgi:hypothetical protein
MQKKLLQDETFTSCFAYDSFEFFNNLNFPSENFKLDCTHEKCSYNVLCYHLFGSKLVIEWSTFNNHNANVIWTKLQSLSYQQHTCNHKNVHRCFNNYF